VDPVDRDVGVPADRHREGHRAGVSEPEGDRDTEAAAQGIPQPRKLQVLSRYLSQARDPAGWYPVAIPAKIATFRRVFGSTSSYDSPVRPSFSAYAAARRYGISARPPASPSEGEAGSGADLRAVRAREECPDARRSAAGVR